MICFSEERHLPILLSKQNARPVLIITYICQKVLVGGVFCVARVKFSYNRDEKVDDESGGDEQIDHVIKSHEADRRCIPNFDREGVRFQISEDGQHRRGRAQRLEKRARAIIQSVTVSISVSPIRIHKRHSNNAKCKCKRNHKKQPSKEFDSQLFQHSCCC